MNSISGSALAGINSGLANLASDAQAVASPAQDALGLVNALVDSTVQRLAVEANAKVLATADQTLGSLIDTFA